MTAHTQTAPDAAPDPAPDAAPGAAPDAAPGAAVGVAVDKEELRCVLAQVLDLDVEEITDDTDFVRDLDLDSLMALEIVVRLQRQYGVTLVERDLQHLTSLPQILQLICVRRAAPFASHPA